MTCLADIDALILAGGLGTRIRPVLGETPKVLAPVAGRPFLDHLLGQFSRFGARRIVLSLGFGAVAVRDYLADRRNCGLDVVVVVEAEPLGTAGAVRHARAALHTDPVLVVNGDSFVDADFCALVKHHRALGTKATILCTEVADGGRYGGVTIAPDGRIAAFAEKSSEGRAVVSAGVYAVSALLLDEIAAGSSRSLEHDVFERSPSRSLGAFVGRFRFVDIGTPTSLVDAQQILQVVGTSI